MGKRVDFHDLYDFRDHSSITGFTGFQCGLYTTLRRETVSKTDPAEGKRFLNVMPHLPPIRLH